MSFRKDLRLALLFGGAIAMLVAPWIAAPQGFAVAMNGLVLMLVGAVLVACE